MKNYITSVWNATFIKQCLGKWLRKRELKSYKKFPCLVLQGIWLSCNNNLLNDTWKQTFHIYP